MTRTEHLLTILAEECAEVAKECSKALRFGLDDAYSGRTVKERLEAEIVDLIAVLHMIHWNGAINSGAWNSDQINAKVDKVERFLRYSAERGRLHEDQVPLERAQV